MLLTDALPSYEIGEELGRGGWGVVLAGRHRQLGRQVAIKQVMSSFAAEPAVRRRFVEEGRVLAAVDHPHVVPVYDFVERDGLCALVMEFLPGGTLRARMAAGRMAPSRAVALVLACTAGIHAAHRVGVLHRDIKPENIMFAGSGALKVTDFGLAKVVGGSMTLATRAGDVLGTPAYIAPEQARGDQVTPATDVYALATMLYEMLSGTLPFRDDGNAMGLLFKHAFEAPIPLTDVAPSVPRGLAAVVMQGLSTDAAGRYASAEAFGLAVATAATEAWGPGWLAAESVPVMGASAMVSISERLSPAGWTPPPAPAEDLVTLLPGHPSAPPSNDTASNDTASNDTARPPSLEVVSLPAPPAAGTPGGGDAAAVPSAPAPGGATSAGAAPPVPGAPDAGRAAGGPGLRKVLLAAAAVAVAVLLLVLLGPVLFTSYDS